MDAIFSFLTTEPVTALSNASGIVGLLITFFVWRSVGKLRKHYEALIRLPQLNQELQDRAASLSDMLNDYANNADAIAVEIARIVPVLNAIKKRLGWLERGTVRSALWSDLLPASRTILK